VLEQLPAKGINHADHARITSILLETKLLMNNAKTLFNTNPEQARNMMEKANQMFAEAKDRIQGHPGMAQVSGNDDSLRGTRYYESAVRAKYAQHDLNSARDDEERALDISRNMYETFISFPECLEKLFSDCLDVINNDLANIGLSTIEIVVHEKRNINQEGYNKVVIVTNELADTVKGRGGEGIVSYPFQWDDSINGLRTVGVDGKWNCQGYTPEDCCSTIKESVPNPDTKGNYIECHMFVPFGGVGNKRRNDRVFINLSPDGRVHEPPMIQ
jgi:hypothetical protein